MADYFDRKVVEDLLVKYQKTGCTDIKLRDEIMSHTAQLINAVVKTHRLHLLARDNDHFDELCQVAWVAIERALYKFVPGKANVFNLFTQIVKTSCLAAVKKDRVDSVMRGKYRAQLDLNCVKRHSEIERFFKELREVCKYIPDYLKMADALEEIYLEDDKPEEFLFKKVSERTGLSVYNVKRFFKFIQLMEHEFTDSKIGEQHQEKPQKPGEAVFYKEDEDDW